VRDGDTIIFRSSFLIVECVMHSFICVHSIAPDAYCNVRKIPESSRLCWTGLVWRVRGALRHSDWPSVRKGVA